MTGCFVDTNPSSRNLSLETLPFFEMTESCPPLSPSLRLPKVPIPFCVLCLTVSLVLVASVSAQTGGKETHKNSLGMQFKEIDGVPVLVSAFETRVIDFETFVKESNYSWSFKPHFPQGSEHPAVNVNLKDAQLFCKWLTQRERSAGLISDLQSYRLPTT